ncbi:hypothetical protein B1H42_05960 [Enterobacter cloacae subsp. cloacae]|nr:hypothetical protein B1H42_05960 [Enterobacter cloacae subsp. cloacae]ORC32039.1 hypothetical protein B2M05_04850 [Enterobacter cloacae subsp. cloacae]
MPIVKWFLWRRWFFSKWTKNYKEQPVMGNLFKTNFASCRSCPIIYRDMVRIIRGHHDKANNLPSK